MVDNPRQYRCKNLAVSFIGDGMYSVIKRIFSFFVSFTNYMFFLVIAAVASWLFFSHFEDWKSTVAADERLKQIQQDKNWRQCFCPPSPSQNRETPQN